MCGVTDGATVASTGGERQKVAVVGTGIAGMTAAYLLADKYDVSVYEAAESPGMDAQSLSLDGESTEIGPRVDVPIRSFSPHYYPNLLALYRKIGIPLQTVNYCQSLSDIRGLCIFQYMNISLGGYTVPFTNPFTQGAMLLEFLRFQWRCWRRHGDPALERMTFEEFVKEVSVSDSFYESFLLCICSNMLSCKIDTVRGYPADILVAFFGKNQTTLLTSWLRARDGAFEVCDKLLHDIPASSRFFGKKVGAISGADESGRVTVTTSDGVVRAYDKVVVATEAHHALGMLDNVTTEEKSILGSFRYESSTACVHRDANMMPVNKSDWRTMNSFVPVRARATSEEKHTMASVSVWMNRLVDVPPSLGDVFQTWNPLVEPEEGTVLSRASFQRAVHDLESAANIARLPHIQGSRGVYYCGSYAARGMTLLEQAVVSSLRVTTALGCPPPWNPEQPPTPAPAGDEKTAGGASYVLPLATFCLPLLALYVSRHRGSLWSTES
eukprot:Rhum_TRINITY_DN8350_c1_g1::Rhum_TRINITY_DN8350_c1_g1_i1::g.27491::m.27491